MISTTDISLRVRLLAAVATNQCPITGHYVTMTDAGIVTGVNPIHTVTNSTTEVTVVPIVPTGVGILKNLQILNSDTATVTVIVEQYSLSSGVAREMSSTPLGINQYLMIDQDGKHILSTTGGIAGSGTVTQVQGNGTVNGITLTGNVTTSGNLTLGGALSGTASGLTAGNVTNIPNLSGVITGNSTGTTTLTANGTNSAGVAGWVSDETGTGSLVFGTNATMVTPNLGTPSAVNLTNAVGLPLTTGVTGVLQVSNGGVDQTAWTSWTPTWTNVTIGNAVVDGKYKQIGKTVFARLDVTFGTTSSAVTTGGTLHSFTLPVNAVSRIAQALLGRGAAYTTQSFLPIAQYKSTSDVYLGFEVVVATLPSTSFNPIGWTNGNILTLELVYEAA